MRDTAKVKVTIEYDGETHTHEGYTFLGTLMTLPKEAAVQQVTAIHYGRVSPGDFLSAVVGVISSANEVLQHVPADVRDRLMLHAIDEGLNGGLGKRSGEDVLRFDSKNKGP